MLRTTNEAMRVGERVADDLRALGVEVIFGIPGVHTIELYRGLERAGLRAVTPRHEQGAGFMADGYARVSGRPGVCVLITGPGVTNALTPIAQAYHDSIPLLVVASTTARGDLGRGRGPLHDLPDQAALVRSVAPSSETVLDPADVGRALERAWTALHTGRPRPAHVAIPIDVLEAPAPTRAGDTAPAASSARIGGSFPPGVARAAAPTDAVERAASLLARATTPAVVLGGGAVDAGASAVALAERLGAPVVLTGNATGTVPSSHPLCAGRTLPFPATQALLAEADVVLLAGTELTEVDFMATGATPAFGGQVIRVDIDPDQLDAGVPADLGLAGDTTATLAALAEAIGPGTPAPEAAERAAAAREILWWDGAREHLPWIAALDEALPADRIVALDSTQLAYTAQHALPMERPRSWLAPYGFGTLGPALPMAIGAKIAAPDRPVIAIAGDGGVLFTIAELGTAVALGLPLPIVVWDNAGYGEIRDSFDRAGAPRLGTEVTTHDLLGVAAGFGCLVETAASPDELRAAVTRALAADGPTVIRVPAS